MRLQDRTACLGFADDIGDQTSEARGIDTIRIGRELMSEAGHFLNAYSPSLAEDGTYAEMRQRLKNAEMIVLMSGHVSVEDYEDLARREDYRRSTLSAEIGLPPPPPRTQPELSPEPPQVAESRTEPRRLVTLSASHVVIAQIGNVDGQAVQMNSLEGRDATITIHETHLTVEAPGLHQTYDLASISRVELLSDGSRLGIAAPGLVTGLLIAEPAHTFCASTLTDSVRQASLS